MADLCSAFGACLSGMSCSKSSSMQTHDFLENSRANKCFWKVVPTGKVRLLAFHEDAASSEKNYERRKTTLINCFISLSRMQSVAWSSTTLLHERIHSFHDRCILNSGVHRCSPFGRKSCRRKWQKAPSFCWGPWTSRSSRCIICLCWQS